MTQRAQEDPKPSTIMESMELKGKRIAVLVDLAYQEMEVWYPIYRFIEAGAEVVTVGPAAGQVVNSKLGYPVKADVAYTDVNARDFDGVVCPGGWAPDYIRRSEAAIKFVAETGQQGKLLAAICHGPWILCSADAIRGRRVTCFHSIKTDVINAGGLYEDAEVVTDGHIVTSRKPEDLPAFMRSCIHVVAAQK